MLDFCQEMGFFGNKRSIVLERQCWNLRLVINSSQILIPQTWKSYKQSGNEFYNLCWVLLVNSTHALNLLSRSLEKSRKDFKILLQSSLFFKIKPFPKSLIPDPLRVNFTMWVKDPLLLINMYAIDTSSIQENHQIIRFMTKIPPLNTSILVQYSHVIIHVC